MESIAKALAEAEAAERHTRVLGGLGSTRNTIKTILALMPVTEVAFAACAKAWEKLEMQKQCDANVERLMQGLSSIFPLIELVDKAARMPHLQSTIEALLNLIKDASRFIVGYNMDGNA
ncbi:hypothetical protein FRC06_010007, partial [Ceratobasidium sp. 370]